MLIIIYFTPTRFFFFLFFLSLLLFLFFVFAFCIIACQQQRTINIVVIVVVLNISVIVVKQLCDSHFLLVLLVEGREEALHVDAVHVLDDLLESGPPLRVLVPTPLHQPLDGLRHAWWNRWPQPIGAHRQDL